MFALVGNDHIIEIDIPDSLPSADVLAAPLLRLNIGILTRLSANQYIAAAETGMQK